MWKIEYDPDVHLLSIRLTDHVGPAAMRDLADAHARALEATGSEPFKLLVDMRGLTPLEDEAVDILADVKRVAATTPGFRGCCVLVDSATVAMQQRRTKVAANETLTLDLEEARKLAAL